MELFNELSEVLGRGGPAHAFCIKGVHYTYAELNDAVARVRGWVRMERSEDERYFGLVANDDLLTYASILAVWLEGGAYVPISPTTPASRNASIVEQAGIRTVFCSSASHAFGDVRVVRTDELANAVLHEAPVTTDLLQHAFILFTSGTTGVPKGVPITRANVSAFIRAFDAMGFALDSNDRCLQMFELTFDLSVMSFLVPLLKGACVYTVPHDGIRYAYISGLLEDEQLTIALMVPNMINNLRPYFAEIHCPSLRYSLFCGEALPLDITTEWSACVPNARILNVYGPTENTIFCTSYEFMRSGENKSLNGILSIGTEMMGTQVIIVDDDQRRVASGASGELCLSGEQLTPGYLGDPERNQAAFFEQELHGTMTRFYRTGDVCRADGDGDLLYLGRLDQQAKIQGYRVELTEIEHHARAFMERHNVVALAVVNAMDTTVVEVVVETGTVDRKALITYLRSVLPAYMIPTAVHCVAEFPLNVNGKTDRKALQRMIQTP